MRIIAGTSKGTTIAAPRGQRTRPTADKVREAIFSILGDVGEARVLDLFAGSGALGLEAISRGAAKATLMDNRHEAVVAMRRNITKLGFDNASVRRGDYLSFLKDAAKKHLHFDLIFVDPPYRMHGVIEPSLARWLPRLAAPGARIVVESSSRQEVTLPMELVTDRLYGDTRVQIYLADGLAASPQTADKRSMGTYSDTIAVCPGTYDPVTEGHLDIIRRAAVLFKNVVVGVVAASPRKETLFSAEERAAFLREELGSNIEVDVFDTLLVDFARKWEARALVKGLRAISDFEYEFQMAQLNRKLAPDLETVYLMASPEYSFLSSSGVKEIAKYGGKVDDLVPKAVARRLAELYKDSQTQP